MKKLLILLVTMTLFYMGGEVGTVAEKMELKRGYWMWDNTGIFVWPQNGPSMAEAPSGWSLFIPFTRVLKITDDLAMEQPISNL